MSKTIGLACIAALLLLSACSGSAQTSQGAAPGATAESAPAATSDAGIAATPSTMPDTEPAPQDRSEFEVGLALSQRPGDREETSGSVPHFQIDAEPVETINAELQRRAFLLPGVGRAPSGVSLPGAIQLALDPSLELARPDVIASSGEFAHIHPDGSMHLWMSPDRAAEVEAQQWGEVHPWVDRDGFWDGVVLLFTPETPEQLEVVLGLTVEAYNLVVGAEVALVDLV